MKTYSTSVLFFFLSIITAEKCAAAGAPPPPPSVIQKCPQKTYSCNDVVFELFGDWLFLQPNGSSIYYAVEAFPYNTSLPVPEVSPNWTVFEIDPGYHSGFEVGSRFLFPKNDMTLEINWERLHSKDSDSMEVTPLSYGTGNMVGPFFDIGPNSAVYKTAKGRAVFHFDAANLIFGKGICFANALKAHFYAGAGFARIKQSLSSTFSNPATSISRTIYNFSTFTGGGPEVGLDFDYNLGCSFYFTGNSSIALYMGQLKNNTTFTSVSPALSQPNVQQTTVPNRTQLIPGFEEKLGFSYAASFDRCEITFGAGYQFQIYLDAVQSVDMTSPQVLPSLLPSTAVQVGVYAVGFERTLSNFILTGPYVSMDISF